MILASILSIGILYVYSPYMNCCKLCKVNTADKKNSHIIPKFLTKSLFHSTPSRHVIYFSKERFHFKKQDTPKENYILCSSCEKRVSLIETIFANYIEKIHNFQDNKEEIDYVEQGSLEYLTYPSINPNFFKLFIFSIVWRTSISKLKVFYNFKLDTDNEEKLRVFLNSYLTKSKKELLASTIDSIPEYNFCLTKPIKRLYPPRSFLSASSSNGVHIITLSEFILLFYTNDNTIVPPLLEISNYKSDVVKIGLGSIKHWEQFNDMLMKRFLSGSKKKQ